MSALLSHSKIPKKILPLCEAIGVSSTEAFLALPLEEFVEELREANNHLRLLPSFPSLEEWAQWRQEVALYEEERQLVIQKELREKEQEWAAQNNCKEARSLDVELYPRILSSSFSRLDSLPEVVPVVSEQKVESQPQEKKSGWDRETGRSVPSSLSDFHGTYLFEPLAEEQVEKLSPREQEIHQSFKKASFFYEEEKARKDLGDYLSQRGIRHLTPVRTYLGALFIVLLLLNFFFCFVFFLEFLYGTELGMTKLMYSLCGLPVTVLGYLIFSMRSRCSVCRNPFFLTKGCPKNHLSHRLPFLGIVIPTALHILLFRWVRCPYCGSAQKLVRGEKERKH